MSTHSKTLVASFGILLGVWIGYNSLHATEIAVVSLVILLLNTVIIMIEKKKGIRSLSFSLVTLLISFGIFFGIIRVQLVEESDPYVCEKVCTVDAVVVRTPEQKDEYQELVVRVDDVHTDVSVRTPLYPRYQIGDTLRLTGKITLPENGMPHENKKSFDYISYLRVHEIGSTMFFPRIEILDKNAHSMSSLLGRIKTEMVERITFSVASPESQLASGMLFGEKGMSTELLQAFRMSGLSHIIVLSGFNIVIIISAIVTILKFFPLFLRVFFAIGSVVMFVMMTGGEASVIRATLMAFIALLATLSGRAYVARQALILSLVAIVLYNPYSLIADVSLHLSFLATAGIVYLTETVQAMFARYRLGKTFSEVIATTLSAYVATLPYVVYTFGTVSLYALLANVLVVPLVPLSMLLSFCTVVFSYVSETLGLFIGVVTSYLLHVIIFIAESVSYLPFAYVHVTVSLLGMVCSYFVLFVSFFMYAHRKKEMVYVTDHITGDIVEDDTVYTY